MKKAVLIIAIYFLPVCFLCAGDGYPSIQVVRQKPHHCGTACAETILRAYGINDLWVEQTALAAALCARLPEYKSRHPEARAALERYYPDFVETYQPELAEFLIDHGYCVVNIRKSVDPATGRPLIFVWDTLKSHLAQGHMAIIHVPKHYLVFIGIDSAKQELYFADTLIPEEVFSCSFSAFSSGLNFHNKRDGSSRGGWDGRALIFWEGKSVNQKDRCPICGDISTGMRYTYCRKCRCFIDRRVSYKVQKAIDVVSTCVEDKNIAQVDKNRLKAGFNSLLTQEGFKEIDLKQALLNYPLAGETPNRIDTLYRRNENREMDLQKLSLDDLIRIVSSDEQ
jgi:hypothetical protein